MLGLVNRKTQNTISSILGATNALAHILEAWCIALTVGASCRMALKKIPFHTRDRQEHFREQGESQRATTRGDDSEVGDTRRAVVLKVRYLDDPTWNPKWRGLHTDDHQTMSEAFTEYCKKQYKRCVHSKGCSIMDSNPPVTHVYTDNDQCFRQRCMNDPLYMRQIERKSGTIILISSVLMSN